LQQHLANLAGGWQHAATWF